MRRVRGLDMKRRRADRPPGPRKTGSQSDARRSATAVKDPPPVCAGVRGQQGTEGEIAVSCISAHDPQLARLADAIAQRVGPQRFHVWFNNSTRLDLKHDALEIAVPND